LDVDSLKAVRKKLDVLQRDNKEFYVKIEELEREKAKLTVQLDGLQEY
jgi:hypothetical protein